MLPNGPIRKVITLKVKFEDLRLHLPLWRHGSRLRKFFDRKFFDQKNFFFKVSKWFNSQSYQVKIEIWKHFPFSDHYGHPCSTLRKFIQVNQVEYVKQDEQVEQVGQSWQVMKSVMKNSSLIRTLCRGWSSEVEAKSPQGRYNSSTSGWGL